MSNAKLKLRKEKKRRDDNKKKILRKREETRKVNKWVKGNQMKTKFIDKMKRKHPKQMEKLEDDDLMKLPQETLKKLERNMSILDALEEEYTREMAQKQKLNDELEAQGHLTPEAKMGALTAKQIEAMKEVEDKKLGEFGGTADCSFTVNKPKKDTADVEVIRAKTTEVEEPEDTEVETPENTEPEE